MLRPGQRVKVNLSDMVVQGVAFSQNVREALGTIVRQTSAAGTEQSYAGWMRSSGTSTRLTPLKLKSSSTR